MYTIVNLPNELLFEIIRNLDVDSIFSLSYSNKRFAKFICSTYVWSELFTTIEYIDGIIWIEYIEYLLFLIKYKLYLVNFDSELRIISSVLIENINNQEYVYRLMNKCKTTRNIIFITTLRKQIEENSQSEKNNIINYYSRTTHFKNILHDIFIDNIPENVYEHVNDKIKSHNIEYKHVTNNFIRECLKDFGYNRYCVSKIKRKLCGTKLPKYIRDHITLFEQMFRLFNKLYNQNYHGNNFINYKCIIHKFCGLLELNYEHLYPTRNKINKINNIINQTCENLNWIK